MVDIIEDDRVVSNTIDTSEVKTAIMLCCVDGHNFTQRYNKVLPEENILRVLRVGDWEDVDDTVDVINSLFTQQYVCDVCERCGLTVGIK